MPTHQPDILTDKKERSDFFIALFVILIAGIYITQTSILNLFASDTQIEPSEDLASVAKVNTEDLSMEISDLSELSLSEEKEIKADFDANLNTDQSTLSENVTHHSSSMIHSTSEIDYTDEMPAIEAIKETSTELRSEVKEELTDAGATVKEKLTDAKTEVQEELKEVIDTMTAASKNIAVNLQETEIDDDIEEERQNVLTSAIQESASEVSDKKDCIIAIGLYRDQKNINVLSNRLKLEGYDMFTKDIKSMTQVGVYISCDPVISKSVLSEIREIYAKDAFIVEL